MKYGIYYAYWEKEWEGDFLPYIYKVQKLGFDILEIACGSLHLRSDAYCRELRTVADGCGITLTGGYGPRAAHNLATLDAAALRETFQFYKVIFHKMELAGVRDLGGALYSYWPVDFRAPLDKEGDFARSVENMKKLADMAADSGITLNMEALNRFEGYLINTCQEDIQYVEAVDKPNVKVMLDSFHMNIEEDSLPDAIRQAGSLLGHFHVGEANRRPPRAHSRLDWKGIGEALHEIGYSGSVVMEPFVRMGGQVGRDISIWRDISGGATDAQLDADVAESVRFLRGAWG